MNNKQKNFVITLVYLNFLLLVKWQLTFTFDMVWLLVGGTIGYFFLEFAEKFFRLNPSPFQTVFFRVVFAVLSFFVVTSSASIFAHGLVLSMFLQMVLRQFHPGLLIIFLLETFFFIR